MLICAQTGEQLENVQEHEFDHQINDIQFSQDRTYFITASKDKSAKVRSDPFHPSICCQSLTIASSSPLVISPFSKHTLPILP